MNNTQTAKATQPNGKREITESTTKRTTQPEELNLDREGQRKAPKLERRLFRHDLLNAAPEGSGVDPARVQLITQVVFSGSVYLLCRC